MIILDGIIYSLQKYGGITVYFNELLKRLQERGEEYVVSLEKPLLQNINLQDAARCVERQARLIERYRTSRSIDGPSNSIFHSTYYRRPSDVRMTTVTTVHDFVYERHGKSLRRLIHSHQKFASIRHAAAIICISEATRRDLLELMEDVPQDRVHVIHNGVSDTFCPLPERSQGRDRPFLIYVGERRGYKNFSHLLAALQFLPEFELLCVGGGPIRDEELSGIKPSVRARIRHLGFVTEAELNERYNAAYCLVYPSSYEGFGIPVVEAMKAGCPVVSIECDAVMEVGGDALTIARSLEPESLVEAVRHLEDSAYRKVVIDKGISRAAQFNWRDTHDRTLAVYKQLEAGKLTGEK
ncbi:glycosyltransferase family 4 protein [Pandoraea apista]|uniref:glycosyltransferase family 4 protein n=1 Tax=Pandoraea apista TaxID=93218 RepID=UPI00248EFEA1|nr:glycosyltransferase family 1 protein [Pandoraea apista]